MKTKLFRQILPSLLVLALGAWAFYEYKQSEKEEKQKIEEASFLNKKLESLKAFRIKKDGKQLEIVKKEQNWFLKQPVQDQASFTEISRWFDEITNQKVQKIQTETGINWKEYHLEKAPGVEMEFSSGETISFSVSKKSSFDGKYFIKKGAELFIGEQYFSSEVNEKDFDSFRSKNLLPSLGHAKKIQFQGKENFTLHWADYKWSLDEANKKKDFPLNSDRLDGFWTDASSMKASAIKEAVISDLKVAAPFMPEAHFAKKAISSISLRKYGLNKPQIEITFSYHDKNKNLNLKLSPFKEDKAFVFVSHRNFILEISKENAEKLILSKKEIRDHAVPFNYKKDSAAQIERKSDKKSFVIKKTKEAWQSLDKEKTAVDAKLDAKADIKVDAKKIESLLDKIKELRGEKYKTGSAKQAKRYLEIKNTAGEIVFELKETSISGSYSWVKTNLWDELVAVSKTSLDEIFNHKIEPDPKAKEENNTNSLKE